MNKTNFLDDLYPLIADELSKMGYPIDPQKNVDLDNLLVRYFDLKQRIPAQIKWKIEQSRELLDKQSSLNYSILQGLKNFIQKAESGQDLKPHLSTRINNICQSDLMFSDWNISHFHLGINPHPTITGFVERTNELLFAIVKQDTATIYLIDILPHKDEEQGFRHFSNQNLIAIIENNWNEILTVHKLSRVEELPMQISNQDIDELRKAGINPVIQTPNGQAIYSLGGGIMSSGKSKLSWKNTQSLKQAVQDAETIFVNNKKDVILPIVLSKCNDRKENFDFKMVGFNYDDQQQIITELRVNETSNNVSLTLTIPHNN